MRLTAPLHALHVTALGLWAGTSAMSGAVAAIVFPTLRDLKPTLAGYAGYTGDHGVLAAGHVAARVFAVADAAAFVCVLLAAATMLAGPALFGQAWRRGLFMTRACVIGGGVALLAYQLLVLAPRMQTNLRGYWDRALAGQSDAAEAFRSAFAADHPTASNVMVAAVLIALAGTFLGALDRPIAREAAQLPPQRP